MLRRISALSLEKAPHPWSKSNADDEGTVVPEIEWVAPSDLYVDDQYQRPITDKGRAIIRRVAGGRFSWRKFKPPVVSMNEEGKRIVLDGQHTATMALTRGIPLIPVVRVQTANVADQADAFVGQNKDRTVVTAFQEHKAMVKAEDATALLVERVCSEAGVKLCLTQKQHWMPNDSMALASIRKLAVKRGEAGALKVLRALTGAALAPISADHVKATDALLFGEEFKGTVAAEKITENLAGSLGVKNMEEAKMFAIRHRVRPWQGLVTTLYQASQRRRAG
jgi:hypothetical protein